MKKILSKIKVAVVQFPGSNCEIETYYAVKELGFSASIVRWNNYKIIKNFAAFIIPGGFSYQDRIRAGVVAAKEPVMQEIILQADKNKPVLGICNGAQILVESALVPGIKNKLEMALAPNQMNINLKIERTGYYCNWVFLKKTQNCIFTLDINNDEILPLPIAHAEGRFTTAFKYAKLNIRRRITLSYCNVNGKIIKRFPENPNNSIFNASAICNKKGNVMAMMPHPERAFYIANLPLSLEGYWGDLRRNNYLSNGKNLYGPGYKVFNSLKKYFLS